jgi:hypothetical protein
MNYKDYSNYNDKIYHTIEGVTFDNSSFRNISQDCVSEQKLKPITYYFVLGFDRSELNNST